MQPININMSEKSIPTKNSTIKPKKTETPVKQRSFRVQPVNSNS